jgi:hypothetical protein
MTKALAELTVSEAASLAIEVIAYGNYEEDKTKKYEWREPFTGTFADWLTYNGDELGFDDEIGDLEDDDVLNVDSLDFDNASAWSWIKYEGGKGTRNGLTAERVAEYGGEGDGDQYWVVISISDGLTTRHFRKDGYYASYDGGYLDGDTSEVKPVEKLVTFYE